MGNLCTKEQNFDSNMNGRNMGVRQLMETCVNDIPLVVLDGDIFQDDSDCLIIAQDCHLSFQNHVANLTRYQAGPSLQQECQNYIKKNGSLKQGQAIITHSGNLKTDYVMHLVLPDFNLGNHIQQQNLHDCMSNALDLCFNKYKIKSIVMPLLTEGVSAIKNNNVASYVLFNSLKRFLKRQTDPKQNQIEIVKIISNKEKTLSIIKSTFEDTFTTQEYCNLKQSLRQTMIKEKSKESFSELIQEILEVTSPNNSVDRNEINHNHFDSYSQDMSYQKKSF